MDQYTVEDGNKTGNWKSVPVGIKGCGLVKEIFRNAGSGVVRGAWQQSVREPQETTVVRSAFGNELREIFSLCSGITSVALY